MSEKQNKYFALIPFFFQVAILLFYLEILEFNFCGLNKNTKKNIQRRELMEAGRYDYAESDIEIDQGYIVDSEDLGEYTLLSLRNKPKDNDN